MMMISPRLIRAAFTLLLFGTVAALLPSPDGTALAGNGCDTGPPGSTGQLAVAVTSSSIRDTYALTPAAVTYKYYFRADAGSAYTQLQTGSSVRTTFTVTSGQVAINGSPYSAGDVYVLPTAVTFMAAQKSIRNSNGVTTGYANGSMTTSSTYTETTNQSSTSGITYTATATFSAP